MRAVVGAPLLSDSPIGSASLAVGMSLYGDGGRWRAGTVAVLDVDLGWRRIDPTDAGLTGPPDLKQKFALSPSGSAAFH